MGDMGTKRGEVRVQVVRVAVPEDKEVVSFVVTRRNQITQMVEASLDHLYHDPRCRITIERVED